MNSRNEYDIAVVGAGAIGMAAALALADLKLSVALVAPGGEPVPEPRDEDDWDSRVFALSPGSRRLLERLRVWDAIPAARVAPIYSMQIRGPRGDAARTLSFDAYDAGISALAWTLENRALVAALGAGLRFAGVTRIPASLIAQRSAGPAVELELSDGAAITARLLVAADGANSAVREQAGIRATRTPYGQSAIVANFRAARPHMDCAQQWFSEQGIIAWLPLPPDSRERSRISLVWSAPEPLAQQLLAESAEALAERTAEAGHRLLGRLEPLTGAQGYPLAALRVSRLIGPRLALVGDAAHVVHPLAGQGMNLGFQDIVALVDVIAAREPMRAIGDPMLLRRYERSRREAVLLAHATFDGLHRAFYRAPAAFGPVRDLGWRALESNGWLKRRLIAQAAQ